MHTRKLQGVRTLENRKMRKVLAVAMESAEAASLLLKIDRTRQELVIIYSAQFERRLRRKPYNQNLTPFNLRSIDGRA